jgi:hypothetical protein
MVVRAGTVRTTQHVRSVRLTAQPDRAACLLARLARSLLCVTAIYVPLLDGSLSCSRSLSRSPWWAVLNRQELVRTVLYQ